MESEGSSAPGITVHEIPFGDEYQAYSMPNSATAPIESVNSSSSQTIRSVLEVAPMIGNSLQLIAASVANVTLGR